MIEQPTSADYVCPRCHMTVKVPIDLSSTIVWQVGRTMHYAHARCYVDPHDAQNDKGVDSGAIVETTQ